MFVKLEEVDSLRLNPLVIRSRYARSLTQSEQHELSRIFSYFAKQGSDPNVQDVFLKDPLSHRQILFILSSDCADLIEAMFQILALANQKISLDENNEYSLQLFSLFCHPELLNVLRQQKGWNHIPDCTDQLKQIRVYVKYYRRPKRSERHKGYRDKGSLPDEQFKLRQECLTEYYAQEAKLLCDHDRELRDTIEVLFGLLQ